MRQPEAATIAVLTGDLVGSSDLTADRLALVRAEMAQAMAAMSRWSEGLVIGDVEFFRGDSWQLALSDPAMSLRAAIGIRLALRAMDMAVDSRIGIGIGPTQRINVDRISLSTGDAFTVSGRVLDGMKRAREIRLELAGDTPAAGWISPLLALCSVVVGRARAGMASKMWHALSPRPSSQIAVAQQLGIQPSSLSSGLRSGGFEALSQAISFFETEADFAKPLEAH